MTFKHAILYIFSLLSIQAVAQIDTVSTVVNWDSQLVINNEPVITKSSNNWLLSINESYLDEEETCLNCETFRFWWLRTFDPPLLIRFNKVGNKYSITYKIGKGASGYSPSGIKKKKTISYSKKEWDYLTTLMSLNELSRLPNNSYMPMTDGTSWIIEYNSETTYKAHYTNWPGESLKSFGYYLIELTKEKFGDVTASTDYAEDKVFLNSKNKIIRQEEITKALIRHINSFLESNTIKDKFCLYPDYIITIKKNGKIGRVRSAYDGNKFFENLSYFFEDRSCRKTYRRALNDLDLSHLDLKDNITFYFTNATWDEQTNQLVFKKF